MENNFKPNGMKVWFVGNAGNDAYVGASGNPFASVSIACTKRWLDKQTNEWQSGQTVWVRINAYGEAAQTMMRVRKGDKVEVIGDISGKVRMANGVPAVDDKGNILVDLVVTCNYGWQLKVYEKATGYQLMGSLMGSQAEPDYPGKAEFNDDIPF